MTSASSHGSPSRDFLHRRTDLRAVIPASSHGSPSRDTSRSWQRSNFTQTFYPIPQDLCDFTLIAGTSHEKSRKLTALSYSYSATSGTRTRMATPIEHEYEYRFTEYEYQYELNETNTGD